MYIINNFNYQYIINNKLLIIISSIVKTIVLPRSRFGGIMFNGHGGCGGDATGGTRIRSANLLLDADVISVAREVVCGIGVGGGCAGGGVCGGGGGLCACGCAGGGVGTGGGVRSCSGGGGCVCS